MEQDPKSPTTTTLGRRNLATPRRAKRTRRAPHERAGGQWFGVWAQERRRCTMFRPRFWEAFDLPCKAASTPPAPTSSSSQDGSLRDDGRISWEKLEEFSFRSWTSMMLSSVLESRTPFAKFLRQTLHCKPLHHAATHKLFFFYLFRSLVFLVD